MSDSIYDFSSVDAILEQCDLDLTTQESYTQLGEIFTVLVEQHERNILAIENLEQAIKQGFEFSTVVDLPVRGGNKTLKGLEASKAILNNLRDTFKSNIFTENLAFALNAALPNVKLSIKAEIPEIVGKLKEATLEWAWQLGFPREHLKILLTRGFELSRSRKPQPVKRSRQTWEKDLPQPTFPEAKATGLALADGVTGRRWDEITGMTALKHAIPGESLEIMFEHGSTLTKWGIPDTYDGLREELRATGTSAVLLFYSVLGNLIERGRLVADIDDYVRLAGLGAEARRSADDRLKCRQLVWRRILIFSHLNVIGRREGKYYDQATKREIDLISKESLFRVSEQMINKDTLYNNSATPFEVTIESSDWLEPLRSNSQVLPFFGNISKLADISDGKVSGDWARSIGLVLNQKWREWSSYAKIRRSGEENKPTIQYPHYFTRRKLLTMFPPKPEHDVFKILHGQKPARARKYWHEAISTLQDSKIIGLGNRYREVEPIPGAKSGQSSNTWADPWLDQLLEIRPAQDGCENSIEIAQKASAVRRARSRKKSQSKKSSK